MAGLPGQWADGIRTQLEQERHAQQLQRITLELELGHHHHVIPELTGVASEHPLDERVAALLMTAYYRSGQQAAALEAFRRIWDMLSNEIGVQPGESLRKLHEGILRHDEALLLARHEPAYSGRGKSATVWPPDSEADRSHAEILTRSQ